MKFLPLFYIFAVAVTFSIGPYETYTAEATIAYVMNASEGKEVKPEPKPTHEDCPCGGTGRIKTGDGLNTTECPCGKDCPCKNKNTVSISIKRVLFFTDRRNCAPCRRTEKQVFPLLKNRGWRIGISNTDHIQVFDSIPENMKAFDDFGIRALGVPTYILLENEKVIGKHTGFMTAKEFGIFFNNGV